MFSSVRGRITLVATSVVAIALLAASVLIVRMVESDLLATTERALAAELELEAAFFDLDAEAQYFEFDADGRPYSLGVFLEEGPFAFGSIVDSFTYEPIAEVVIDTEAVEVAQLVDPFSGEIIVDSGLASSVEALNFDLFDVDGEDGNMLLVGAVARDEVDETLAAVRGALLLIVPLLAALMGALIWWLVGRALQPVQAMSNRVAAITTSSLDQRVPVPKGNDAVSGLAMVMNTMLSRLERGDLRQRQFAADASHELRSPIATVRAAAEMIQRQPHSQRLPALSADIVAESDRMDALIGDLLQLSRIDELSHADRHGTLDFSALVEHFATAHAAIEPGLYVVGDEDQLRRVIENLMNNASRHARAVVRLDLRRVVHAGTPYAELCIEDDGDGVPADMRSMIFERFRRLDEARSRDRGGAGLGLALVKTIVHHHGGTITVDDSPTLTGARFRVQLPITTNA